MDLISFDFFSVEKIFNWMFASINQISVFKIFSINDVSLDLVSSSYNIPVKTSKNLNFFTILNICNIYNLYFNFLEYVLSFPLIDSLIYFKEISIMNEYVDYKMMYAGRCFWWDEDSVYHYHWHYLQGPIDLRNVDKKILNFQLNYYGGYFQIPELKLFKITDFLNVYLTRYVQIQNEPYRWIDYREKVTDSNNIFNVLESFSITKHIIQIKNDFIPHKFNWLYDYFYYQILAITNIIHLLLKENILKEVSLLMHTFYYTTIFTGFFFHVLFVWFYLIKSFFFPSPFLTKNFIYGRLARFVLKFWFQLFIKKKIYIFFKYKAQYIKNTINLLFQQNIKTNFGHHYPYYNRLLNFYPFFISIFFLILFHNFNGLLFYGFTNTAFLLQNCIISFQSVVGLTILGIFLRSYHFYKMFVPSNVPNLLKFPLVIIEIISHIAKIFSLAIRLFANMMAGHVLLHILTGFVINLGKKNLLFTILPLMIILSVVVLEYGITFLQAYVFITLLSIYFEEHFGFAQEEQIVISNLISINNKNHKLNKVYFLYCRIIRTLKRRKFYFVARRDRYLSRRYGRFELQKKWFHTTITFLLFNFDYNRKIIFKNFKKLRILVSKKYLFNTKSKRLKRTKRK